MSTSTTRSTTRSTSDAWANLYFKDDTMPLSEHYINESLAPEQPYPPFNPGIDVVVVVDMVMGVDGFQSPFEEPQP